MVIIFVMTIGIFGGKGEPVELKTYVSPNGMIWELVVKKSPKDVELKDREGAIYFDNPKEILRVNYTQDTITYNRETYVKISNQNQ